MTTESNDTLSDKELTEAMHRTHIFVPWWCPICPKCGKQLIWMSLYEYVCVCRYQWWGGQTDEDCIVLLCRGKTGDIA